MDSISGPSFGSCFNSVRFMSGLCLVNVPSLVYVGCLFC